MLIRFFGAEYIFSELVRIMAIRNRAVARSLKPETIIFQLHYCS